MSPEPASTVPTAEQEAIAVAFRRHTLLPLDDCRYALQATIPLLSRSALHRCFQRHGISRLPLSEDGQGPPKKSLRTTPSATCTSTLPKCRPKKASSTSLWPLIAPVRWPLRNCIRAKRVVAAEFLRRVLDKLPYRVNTVLIYNGVQFTPHPHQFLPGGHRFDRICRKYSVEHRLTKPAHPWTNGQVERMNRTINEATVQRYHYQTTDELNEHLQAFLLAYNHAKCLKTLRWLTPLEFVCTQWQMYPTIFTRDPAHLTLGLYS